MGSEKDEYRREEWVSYKYADGEEDPEGSSSVSSPSSSCLDDKSSSSSSSPLYELSQLINGLPVERGLSKHYGGRSQSYTSLTKVKRLEDLEKKESSSYYGFKRRRNSAACKMWRHHYCRFGPKECIAKKVSSKKKMYPIAAFELEKCI